MESRFGFFRLVHCLQDTAKANLLIKLHQHDSFTSNLCCGKSDLAPESKKPPTGSTEQTPKKPEFLISLAPYLGVRWEGPIQFFMDRNSLHHKPFTSFYNTRAKSHQCFYIRSILRKKNSLWIRAFYGPFTPQTLKNNLLHQQHLYTRSRFLLPQEHFRPNSFSTFKPRDWKNPRQKFLCIFVYPGEVVLAHQKSHHAKHSRVIRKYKETLEWMPALRISWCDLSLIAKHHPTLRLPTKNTYTPKV